MRMLIDILKNKTTTWLSFVFSLTSTIGWVFCAYPGEDLCFKSAYKPFILTGVFAGFLIAYKLIFVLLGYLSGIIKRECSHPVKQRSVSYFIFDKHPFAIFLFISVLMYGFWWFAFFPGTLHPDMTPHLYQGLGVQSLNKIAPIFLTKVVGFIMTVAKVYFLNDNVGAMVYVAGLLMLQCLTVGYIFVIFKKIGTPYSIRWLACIYFFIIPVYSVWVVNFGKDTPYYLFVLLFTCILADCLITYKKTGNVKWWSFALLIIVCLGASWTRNNGSAIVITSLIITALCYKKLRLKLLTSCMICILVLAGFDMFLNGHYEISPSPKGESYSLPLQTYASYLGEYYEELDAEEFNLVLELFSASPAEVAALYDPMTADPVKNRFILYPSSEQLKDFWRCYREDFFEHPGVFTRGFFRHVYGYFYPGQECYSNRIAIYTLDFLTEHFSFKYAWNDSPLREWLIDYSEGVYHLPIVNYIYRPGSQMLILFSLAASILSGKRKRLVCVLIPSMLMIFVVFSPVNAYFRYMLPVFVALPVNLAWTFHASGFSIRITEAGGKE